jgi:hypothetical protein
MVTSFSGYQCEYINSPIGSACSYYYIIYMLPCYLIHIIYLEPIGTKGFSGNMLVTSVTN